MKFSLVLVAMAATAAATPLVERGSPEITQLTEDLSTIESDAKVLLEGLKQTESSNFFADLGLEGPADKLLFDINRAERNAEKIHTSDVTQANAKTIFAQFTAIEPVAKNLCVEAARAAPGFRRAGVYGVVQPEIATIPERVNKIGALVLGFAPDNYQARGKALLSKYRTDLDVCVKAYPPL